MNKKLYLALSLVLVVIAATLILSKNKNEEPVETISPPELNPNVESNMINVVDTTAWSRVDLHQNIKISIPDDWTIGTDGIYNYNYLEVTGIRDENFPDNSFKCVFYKDDTLRAKFDVINEETLSDTPLVTSIEAAWNKAAGELRQEGEVIKIYSNKREDSESETFVECTVFKGEMTEEDKNLLENMILTIQ